MRGFFRRAPTYRPWQAATEGSGFGGTSGIGEPSLYLERSVVGGRTPPPILGVEKTERGGPARLRRAIDPRTHASTTAGAARGRGLSSRSWLAGGGRTGPRDARRNSVPKPPFATSEENRWWWDVPARRGRGARLFGGTHGRLRHGLEPPGSAAKDVLPVFSDSGRPARPNILPEAGEAGRSELLGTNPRGPHVRAAYFE